MGRLHRDGRREMSPGQNHFPSDSAFLRAVQDLTSDDSSTMIRKVVSGDQRGIRSPSNACKLKIMFWMSRSKSFLRYSGAKRVSSKLSLYVSRSVAVAWSKRTIAISCDSPAASAATAKVVVSVM